MSMKSKFWIMLLLLKVIAGLPPNGHSLFGNGPAKKVREIRAIMEKN